MPICQGYVQKFKQSTLLLNLIYINIFYAGLNSKLAWLASQQCKNRLKNMLGSPLISTLI